MGLLLPFTWTTNGAAKLVPATALCPSPEIFWRLLTGTRAVSVKVPLMAELPASDTVMLTLPAATPEKLATVEVWPLLSVVEKLGVKVIDSAPAGLGDQFTLTFWTALPRESTTSAIKVPNDCPGVSAWLLPCMRLMAAGGPGMEVKV